MSKRVRVEFVDTLMRWFDEFHVESGDRHSTFYFRVPDSWATGPDAELQRRVFEVAQQMYVDLNAGFRAAQPDDYSYMRVKGTRATVLNEAEEQAMPWRQAPAPAVWEPTACVAVEEDGSYRKVDCREL